MGKLQQTVYLVYCYKRPENHIENRIDNTNYLHSSFKYTCHKLTILIELEECNNWNQLPLSESPMTMIISVSQGICNQYVINIHLKNYNDMIQVQNRQTIIFLWVIITMYINLSCSIYFIKLKFALYTIQVHN